MSDKSDKKDADNPDVKVRSLVLQTTVWDALDEDARKCRRSSVKQLEAILVAYYKLGNIELDYDQLEKARRIVGPQTVGGKVEILGYGYEPEESTQPRAKPKPRTQQPKKKKKKDVGPLGEVGFRIIGMGRTADLGPPNRNKTVPPMEEKISKKKGPRNEG